MEISSPEYGRNHICERVIEHRVVENWTELDGGIISAACHEYVRVPCTNYVPRKMQLLNIPHRLRCRRPSWHRQSRFGTAPNPQTHRSRINWRRAARRPSGGMVTYLLAGSTFRWSRAVT
jgi:hypothetical protein